MEIIVAILRGINVSGQKKIQMAGLRTLFEAAGFKNVTTYIQSGNVVFQNHHLPLADLPKSIQEKIYGQYNFEVPVITRSMAEMENVLCRSLWRHDENLDKEKLHVTFLAELPAPEHLQKITPALFEPDKFVVQGKEVYLFCPNGYGNTKLTNSFFEKKLKVTATTRNWRTVNELLRLMKANASTV